MTGAAAKSGAAKSQCDSGGRCREVGPGEARQAADEPQIKFFHTPSRGSEQLVVAEAAKCGRASDGDARVIAGPAHRKAKSFTLATPVDQRSKRPEDQSIRQFGFDAGVQTSPRSRHFERGTAGRR